MMAGKRKKKGRPRLPPRRKRMKCEKRLKAAKAWIPQYEGKNLVKGYRKHFGVDILCAIKELQMLGIEFSDPISNRSNGRWKASGSNGNVKRLKRNSNLT